MKIGRNEPCPCGSGKKYKKCCLDKTEGRLPLSDYEREIDNLMDAGYVFLQMNEDEKACDAWLVLWERLKLSIQAEILDAKDWIRMFQRGDSIYDWCQDFEMELGNAGLKSDEYHRKRITYCEEFCDFFPNSEELILHNMWRAIGESQAAIGEVAEADQTFQELIADYPDNIWGYIGWGDLYAMPPGRTTPPDRVKAEQIYQKGLGLGLEDEGDLLDRIEKLREENNEAN